MRSVVVFKTNTPTTSATSDREAVTTGGQNDVYTTLLTTRGRLRKISGGRSLDFGLIENRESYKLLCRFQSALEYSITANMKVDVDNKSFTVDTWEKVDEINHLYEFVLNIQKVFQVVLQLGSELVTNGSFTGNITGWNLMDDSGGAVSGFEWFYDTNKVTHAIGNSLTLFQSGVLDATKIYRVSMNISGTAGSVGVHLGSSLVPASLFAAGSGDVTFDSDWFNGVTIIKIHPSSDFNGSITNVSIKQIL